MKPQKCVMLLVNCWMRCVSHSKRGFPHICSAFLQEYFIIVVSLFRPKPFVSFNRLQRTVSRHPSFSFSFFPNTKFFRQVGMCLKIDVPLLFSLRSPSGLWLDFGARVAQGMGSCTFFLTLALYLLTEHKYRRESIRFLFLF